MCKSWVVVLHGASGYNLKAGGYTVHLYFLQKVEKRKMEERPLIPLSDVKAPLDLSSEYGPPHPIVLPVRFSTVRSKTVEGILTVV